MSGRRPDGGRGAVTGPVATSDFFQNRNAGELLAFEVLERRAAAGGDVPEGVLVEAERAYGRGRVAAADDGEALRRRHGLGDALRTGRERRELEDAHGAVPEDGLRVGQCLGEEPDGVGT